VRSAGAARQNWKNSLKIIVKSIALLLALGASAFAISASAQTFPKTTIVAIDVKNASNTCAWVTIYWGRLYTPWTIESEPDGRPRFVNHQSSHTFFVRFTNPTSVPIPAEIKVRAEFTRNSNCSGGTIADHDNYNKGIMADKSILERVNITSVLSGPPYGVSRPQ